MLIAVVNEFASKAEKAVHHDDERTAVIELEQAGDSAKAAAEADTGVADATRQAVLDAHPAICIAKPSCDFLTVAEDQSPVDLLEQLRVALDDVEPLLAGRIVDIEMARRRVLTDPVLFRREFAR